MNLQISDFEKLEHKTMSHYIFKAFLGILASEEELVDSPVELSD
jgi:hypothetical protein